MLKAAVIGCPVSQSLSPKIHNYWLKKYAIKGSYTAIEVVEDELETFIKNMARKGFCGCNVTVPYKEKIISLVDEISSKVKKVGAANTLVVKEKGIIFADNTDVFGFTENIKKHCEGFSFLGKNAVVLGAGGAARAIIVGLLEEGVKRVVVLNRTRTRAEALRNDFIAYAGNIEVCDWDMRNDVLVDAHLLVNTTILGMQGQGQLDIDLKFLPKEAVVNDIVYKPLNTKLLLMAKARGHYVVDGIGMLLYQAVKGFYCWFGKMPEVDDELKRYILQYVI